MYCSVSIIFIQSLKNNIIQAFLNSSVLQEEGNQNH